MPTFFGRKYMRGKPGPTEKCVGAFVLGLLAFILLAFLLTGGLFGDFVSAHPALARARDLFGISQRPLFVADPRSLPAPPPPRELRVAESLLPATLSESMPGGSIRVVPLTAATSGPADEPALVRAARAAEARWASTRSYGPNRSAVVTAWVADFGSPEAALKVCRERTPGNARPLAVGRGGWTAGKSAGFWSGRYYTEVSSENAQAMAAEAAARVLGGRQLAYGNAAPGRPPEKAVAGAAAPSATGPATGTARFAEVPGGKIVAPTRIERYAENLYEKIDGKESAFRAFYVVDLKFAQYAEPDRQQSYDVYIYDMAAPVNAMGIYMSERVEKAAPLAVGREGYVSGTSVFFWKGRYYVNVLGPPDGGEAALGVSKQIAAAVAGTIADVGEPFWADKVLPAEDRVPFSLAYQATSALGYEFLKRMFLVNYEVGGKRLQVFITRAASPDAAKALFSRFAESVGRYDKVLSKESIAGGDLVLSESPRPNRPSRFGAAFWKGPYFGGVSNCEDRELAARRAKGLVERLSATAPGDPESIDAPPPASGEHGANAPAGDGGTGEGESGSSEGSEGGH